MAAAEDGGGLADRLVEVVTSLEGVGDSVLGIVTSMEGVADMTATLERAGESLNSTLTRLLDLGPGALPPPAVLSLASVIGLAMLVQEGLRPGGAARKLMRRVGEVAGRTGGSRRRLPTPYLELDTEPDWWAEPDYEYIDQEDIEDVRGWFENNRKTSENSDGTKPYPEMDFSLVDYDNYEYHEVGNLNFKRKPRPKKKSSNTLSKRQQSIGGLSVHISRPRRPQAAQRLAGRLPKIRSRVGSSPFLEGLSSRFDFSSMVTVAGLWYVWNAYLSGYVPTTILQDLANNIGNFGRSVKTDSQMASMVTQIIKIQDREENTNIE